ncbi:putative alcohol dehydrogenase [Entomophthora muscae]|uniref:Alcohol dehydrogenase n=1 Tax=Entomophthora muscae TaxID=34485 RepID=A0ACC2SMU6_9FUNG|nr:putative alcohol dehydrogenase [Entomophthora muscae]
MSAKYSEITGWACHGKGEELKQFSYSPGELLANDVEIEISHCAICGSDLHTMDSGWGATDYPCIVGHEIIGKVTAVGQQVKQVVVGDRVGVGAQSRACLQSDCFACSRNFDAHCPKATWTYNSKRHCDGAKSFGGYANAIRVQEDYAFKVPESIPSEYAASLLCAGTTVFTPMLRHKLKAGDKVGIIGIGGLGHLAVKFASALGCEVTAISHSSNKKEEALEMGATQFVDTSVKEQVKQTKNRFQFLLVASNANNMDFALLNSFMDICGKIILVGLPEEQLHISPFMFVHKDISLVGSNIGSINEVKATLEFAAKHNIRPTIEQMPMAKVNDAVNRVRTGNVRYRMVLEN